MLGVSITATSPVLAMEIDRFQNEDVTKTIIKSTDYQGAKALSLTSKKIYKWTEEVVQPEILQEKFMAIDPSLSLRAQLCSYLSLFRDPTKQYKISIPQLISFKSVLVDDKDKGIPIYRFSIGTRNFFLNSGNNPYGFKDKGIDKLPLLNEDAYLIFSSSPSHTYKSRHYFSCSVQICLDKERTKNLKFNSQEYKELLRSIGLANTATNVYDIFVL